jgi:hypothetical protein
MELKLINLLNYNPWLTCTICLKPGLKDFLERCLMQFEVYIWSEAQQYNIKAYSDKI